MATQETIQIRIDSVLKNKAKATLEELGLDMSSAIKLFLHNVVILQGIPLNLRTANGFTLEEEQVLLAETWEAKKSGKGYKKLDTLFTDLAI